jgi:hypothetical protein
MFRREAIAQALFFLALFGVGLLVVLVVPKIINHRHVAAVAATPTPIDSNWDTTLPHQ